MAWSKSTRIILMLAINTTFLILELGVGVVVGSLALLADAFHMLNDIISLGVGLWAVVVAKRSTSEKFSFGYFRAEILSAFFNAVFLIALCLTITLEAIQRLIDPPEIGNPELIFTVGCLGLASNIIGFFILGGLGHSHAHDHGHSAQSVDEEIGALAYDSSVRVEGGHIQSPQNEITSIMKPKTGHGVQKFASEDQSGSSLATGKNSHRRVNSVKSGHFSQEDLSIHPASFRQNIIAASRSKLNELFDDGSSFKDEILGEETNEPRTTPGESSPLITKSHNHRNANKVGSKKESHGSVHHGHNHSQPKRPKDDSHSHTDMGMNAMILHVIGDALGNVGVIISALIIWLTNWSERFYADPAVSLFITLIIMRSAIPLTIATAKILLQATPDHIEVHQIRDDIQALPGVISCHHVHIWQLSDTQIVASMHLQLELSMSEATGEKYMEISRAVRRCLHAYGIHSATIQPEFCLDEGHAHSSQDISSSVLENLTDRLRCSLNDQCLLKCIDGCYGKTCCSQQTTKSQKDHSHHDDHTHG